MTPLLLLAICMADTLEPLVVLIHVKITEARKSQAEPAQLDNTLVNVLEHTLGCREMTTGDEGCNSMTNKLHIARIARSQKKHKDLGEGGGGWLGT